jgi:hypothetical protein
MTQTPQKIPDDSKFLHDLGTVIALRVGNDPFLNYVLEHKLEQFKGELHKFRRYDGNITIYGTYNFKGYYWTNIENQDDVIQPHDATELNYQLECFGFTDQILAKRYEFRAVTQAQLLKAIQENNWVTAKATKNPHQYALRFKWNANTITWYEFMHHINTHGTRQGYWSRSYIVCNVGGHDYWIMGNSESLTIILNRREKGHAEPTSA